MSIADAFGASTVLPGASVAVVGVSSAGPRGVIGSAPGADADTSFRIASLTKAFTSAALVLELHDRAIGLDTPAIEFFGDIGSDWRADRSLTVAHLLAQVAGLRESVDAPMAAAAGEGEDALTAVVRMVVGAGSERDPGERWSYYNGNYFVAGAILARVCGTSFETALRDRILGPWGLTRSGFEQPTNALAGWNGERELATYPYPRARRPSGGLWSTAGDLITFAERILADDRLLEAIARRRTDPADPMPYGLGWALGPSGQLYLNGRLPGYRAALLLISRHAFAAVGLANQENALPLIADCVSRQQLALTGDDVAGLIDAFAA